MKYKFIEKIFTKQLNMKINTFQNEFKQVVNNKVGTLYPKDDFDDVI